MKTIQYEPLLGTNIRNACVYAGYLSRQNKARVMFNFNGVSLYATPKRCLPSMLWDWEVAMSRLEAKYRPQREAMLAKYREKDRQKSLLLQGALSTAPSFDVIDAAGWEKCKANNSDPYVGRAVRYAEEWGRLMQTRIDNGEKLEDCADELSRLADDDGITGFMYGAAVSILAGCWRHGDALRRWHNRKTQIGTEGDEANDSGGVLNHAVLVMSK